jgi:hypothetical protein
MSYTTLLANDPESDKYIITRGGSIVGRVLEARYNGGAGENGLMLVDATELDTAPYTLKKRPPDDYTDQNLITVFTNEV